MGTATSTAFPRHLLTLGVTVLGFGLLWTSCVAMAADSDPDSDTAPAAVAQARKSIAAGDYAGAIAALQARLQDAPDDADALNLMGYSHRKSGNGEKALRFYGRALEVEPKHRGANEYLGQLYLEMGQPEKARERLAVLDGACFFGCEEYTELKEAIEAYEKKSR